MLEPLEHRLTDILTNSLIGSNNIVVRPRDDIVDLLTADAERVIIIVRLLTAVADDQVGDDARERLGQRGAYQLRTTLFLTGEVAVDFSIAETPQDGDPLLNRPLLMQALDRTLVALHEDSLRQGQAFQTGANLGFDLTGFRFKNLGPIPEQLENFHTFRVTYQYRGRFWPLAALATGDVISALPTRIAVLPIKIPEHIEARAGGADITIPLHIDLRALNGAPANLVARMQGASPPGTLIGETTAAPAGYTLYTANVDTGVFNVVYRPPASLNNTTQVRTALMLAHSDRPTIPLGELTIKVIS